jgi:hypothetical protein
MLFIQGLNAERLGDVKASVQIAKWVYQQTEKSNGQV